MKPIEAKIDHMFLEKSSPNMCIDFFDATKPIDLNDDDPTIGHIFVREEHAEQFVDYINNFTTVE